MKECVCKCRDDDDGDVVTLRRLCMEWNINMLYRNGFGISCEDVRQETLGHTCTRSPRDVLADLTLLLQPANVMPQKCQGAALTRVKPLIFYVSPLPEPKTKCGGVHSRPLDSDDLRMIEEDLSKQLGSSPRDWDADSDLEPYVTTLENGGSPVYNNMFTPLKCVFLGVLNQQKATRFVHPIVQFALKYNVM